VRVLDILFLSELQVDGEVLKSLINETGFNDSFIPDRPINGSSEIWEFINLTEDVHPMHVHLVQFLILERQPFNETVYLEQKKINFHWPGSPSRS